MSERVIHIPIELRVSDETMSEDDIHKLAKMVRAFVRREIGMPSLVGLPLWRTMIDDDIDRFEAPDRPSLKLHVTEDEFRRMFDTPERTHDSIARVLGEEIADRCVGHSVIIERTLDETVDVRIEYPKLP